MQPVALRLAACRLLLAGFPMMTVTNIRQLAATSAYVQYHTRYGIKIVTLYGTWSILYTYRTPTSAVNLLAMSMFLPVTNNEYG